MIYFDGGGGQSPTQYPRWINETGSYEVPFISGFEPWGIVYRYALFSMPPRNPRTHWRVLTLSLLPPECVMEPLTATAARQGTVSVVRQPTERQRHSAHSLVIAA